MNALQERLLHTSRKDAWMKQYEVLISDKAYKDMDAIHEE